MTLSSPTAPPCPLPERPATQPTALDGDHRQGLTRCYDGIDNEARSALAAAEPPLTGTVCNAVIAATVEHVCTTHHAEVPPTWTQTSRSTTPSMDFRPSVC